MSNWTQSDLDKLNRAIASSARRVEYADRTVEYRSISEMIRVRDMILEDLGQKKSTDKTSYAQFSKGID